MEGELKSFAQKLAQQGMRIVKDDLPPLGNLKDEWTACLSEAARQFGALTVDFFALSGPLGLVARVSHKKN